MVVRFIYIDRHTPMLLPPDLRDWIGEDILAGHRTPLADTRPEPDPARCRIPRPKYPHPPSPKPSAATVQPKAP